MSAYLYAVKRNIRSELRDEIVGDLMENLIIWRIWNIVTARELHKMWITGWIVEDLMEIFPFLQENKPWIIRILVTASLSLAAKMRNINNLPISHIIIPVSNNSSLDQSEHRDNEGLIFNLQSVHRMENLILTTLNWRLRSITPFAFLQFFNSLFELSNNQSLSQSLEDRASDVIFISHYGTVLSYRIFT